MASLSSPLDLEPAIVERLRSKLAEQQPAVHVLTAADLAGVAEEKQVVPAVHLVYQGYRVAQARGDGAVAKVAISWLAVVATRSVRGLVAGDEARSQAGALMGRVFKALSGFQPAGAATPLLAVTPPGAGYSSGFQYMPLAFECEGVLNNQP